MGGSCKYIQRFLLVGLVAFSLPLAAKDKEPAGPPRCFMHGIMISENKEKSSLSDMIRLHFDVKNPDDIAKCEQMMESYCENNVRKKEYSPVNLKGSFKPDVNKSEETSYHFTKRCKVEAD